ncbi:hypothetical protein P7D22_06570 [Lichenihabitans sp. Uapishka_5]|uniref:DUF6894 family protein n=1 Tax=Lichenihabitans sp. Uapishka_5 TaxID=3037302 RepID=UPI0029E81A0F|nr:hypothetical protein [Lichenihabitans sp. Uapishka_5]MDX7950841.1 hypothetical protein [Lichenihabitans sp. Uapishka_5]
MPRYFFEIVQDGTVHEDLAGTDLASASDLEEFTVRRAAETLLAAVELSPPEWWLMEVKDEHRNTVGRVSFVASGFQAPDRSH